MQIVAEFFGKAKLTVLNIDNASEPSILNEINSMLNGSLIEQIDVIDVKEEDLKNTNTDGDKTPEVIVLNGTTCDADVSYIRSYNFVLIFFMHYFICHFQMLETLYHLYSDAFLVTMGVNAQEISTSSLLTRVSVVGKGLSRLELSRWKSKPLSAVALTVARPEDLQCLITSRTNLQPHQKLVVFTSYPPPSDLKNLVKCWRADIDRNQVYLAMVTDRHRVDMKQLPSFELPYNIFYQVINQS